MSKVRKFSFTLKHENFKVCNNNSFWTVAETHFNVLWYCHFSRIYSKQDERNILISVCCGKERGSNLWAIDVTLKATLKSATAGITYTTGTTLNESRSLCSIYPTLSEEVFEKFVTEKAVTITCEVIIERMTGIHQSRTVSFDQEHSLMTDVVLVVQKKEFHVSKVILASFSPVFLAMFSNGFREAKEKKVVIKAANDKVFETFLMMIYSCDPAIHKDNVKGLLELADRYDVDVVRNKCEFFAMFTDKLSTQEKLQLAEQYGLSGLQKHSLDGLKTMKDVRDLSIDADKVGEATIRALYSKLVYMKI